MELAALLSTLQDAETGQWGYLLMGDDAYLQPYRDATASMQIEVGRLKEDLIADTAHVSNGLSFV